MALKRMTRAPYKIHLNKGKERVLTVIELATAIVRLAFIQSVVKWRAGQKAEKNLEFANSRFVVSICTGHLGIIRAVTGLGEISRLVIGILSYQAS